MCIPRSFSDAPIHILDPPIATVPPIAKLTMLMNTQPFALPMNSGEVKGAIPEFSNSHSISVL
jgi:hypothetical protein